jgi:hypothetical protein
LLKRYVGHSARLRQATNSGRAEGRWFQTESGKFDGPATESFDGEFETFDVIVGIRYVFGRAK